MENTVSKKLSNNMVEPLDQNLTDEDKKYLMSHNKAQKVKSFKTFFMKLRGSNPTEQGGAYNESLFSSTPSINTLYHSAQAGIDTNNKPKKMISKLSKNHQLNTTENSNQFRRCQSNNRHTLDFSNIVINYQTDIGVPLSKKSNMSVNTTPNTGLRRANSLCSNSIYSSLISPIDENQKISPTINNSSSTTSSSSSSSSPSFSSSISPTSHCGPPCIKDQSMKSDTFTSLVTEKKFKKKNNRLSLIVDNTAFQDQDESFQIQKKLWEEDPSICTKEEIAEYLGSNSPTRSRILYLYMNNFDFSNQRLDNAFRKLCTKLYFKAESQQLDRIIEAFAKRFYACNPTSIFPNVDVIHAIAYSLLLLNTDLHVVSDWANKMTKSKFVKNTMETISSIITPPSSATTLFEYHHRHYLSMATQQNSPIHHERDEGSPSTISSFFHQEEDSPMSSGGSSYASTLNGGVIHKLDALRSWKSLNGHSPNQFRTQKSWFLDIENLLKEMYVSVRNNRIDQADLSAQSPSTTSTFEIPLQPSTEEPSPSRPPQIDTSPLSKTEGHHGLVMRKHVMESPDKRARNRQWQLCYVVMSDTEMIMYKPMCEDGKRKKNNLWNSSNAFSSLQDIMRHQPCWQPDKEQAPTVIKMNHTYTTALPAPGWNAQRPHVFRFETADGGHWLFESTDSFAVQAWVEACNGTASRISKKPLPGAICNIDYGWGAQWDTSTAKSFTEVPIWYPPSPCGIDSTLDLNEQYQDISTQIVELNQELTEHNASKIYVEKKLTYGYEGYVNSTQALTNWERKLQYLTHELVKLECYKEALQSLIS